jgi:hypothetical protein
MANIKQKPQPLCPKGVNAEDYVLKNNDAGDIINEHHCRQGSINIE